MNGNIFMDKSIMPGDEDLKKVLGDNFSLWQHIREFVLKQYPKGLEEWYYPGAKYGWNFRIKDKKRAIVYMAPRANIFIFSMIFGEKATQQILKSVISDDVKKMIREAPVYAEGRGFRLDVTDDSYLEDIKLLIDIKIAN